MFFAKKLSRILRTSLWRFWLCLIERFTDEILWYFRRFSWMIMIFLHLFAIAKNLNNFYQTISPIKISHFPTLWHQFTREKAISISYLQNFRILSLDQWLIIYISLLSNLFWPIYYVLLLFRGLSIAIENSLVL